MGTGMGEDDDLKLAELLCARICHDLSGPIGAAVAGSELLADDGAGDPEVGQMLGASIGTAAAHLKFLRAALGHGVQPMRLDELRGLVQALLPARGAVAVEWHHDDAGTWPRDVAKLLLNLVMIARDSLPRGGTVRVSLTAEPPAAAIEATGPQLAREAAEALAAPSLAGLTPRGAQAYYAARLARAAGARLTVDWPADRLVLRVVERRPD